MPVVETPGTSSRQGKKNKKTAGSRKNKNKQLKPNETDTPGSTNISAYRNHDGNSCTHPQAAEHTPPTTILTVKDTSTEQAILTPQKCHNQDCENNNIDKQLSKLFKSEFETAEVGNEHSSAVKTSVILVPSTFNKSKNTIEDPKPTNLEDCVSSTFDKSLSLNTLAVSCSNHEISNTSNQNKKHNNHIHLKIQQSSSDSEQIFDINITNELSVSTIQVGLKSNNGEFMITTDQSSGHSTSEFSVGCELPQESDKPANVLSSTMIEIFDSNFTSTEVLDDTCDIFNTSFIGVPPEDFIDGDITLMKGTPIRSKDFNITPVLLLSKTNDCHLDGALAPSAPPHYSQTRSMSPFDVCAADKSDALSILADQNSFTGSFPEWWIDREEQKDQIKTFENLYPKVVITNPLIQESPRPIKSHLPGVQVGHYSPLRHCSTPIHKLGFSEYDELFFLEDPSLNPDANNIDETEKNNLNVNSDKISEQHFETQSLQDESKDDSFSLKLTVQKALGKITNEISNGTERIKNLVRLNKEEPEELNSNENSSMQKSYEELRQEINQHTLFPTETGNPSDSDGNSPLMRSPLGKVWQWWTSNDSSKSNTSDPAKYPPSIYKKPPTRRQLPTITVEMDL